MINVNDKSKCSGCGACDNACPTKCITMEYDKKGFLYPTINLEKCVKCNKCSRVCPYLNDRKISREKPATCYAAYSRDEMNLQEASSGGVFWELVKAILLKKGSVYGAVSEDGIHVYHQRGISIDTCLPMRKSKYQQSRIGNSYQLVKEDLDKGKNVLFSGTPCQVAGLYGYLGGDNEKLITIDLVCHGVPSKEAFNKYRKMIEKEKNSRLTNIIWRDKSNGWANNSMKLIFEDSDRNMIISSAKNAYSRGFAQCLYLRPSCYSCPYDKMPRIGDVTLGDFFGYDKSLKNEDKGLSMVVASSLKGQKLIEEVLCELEYDKVSERYCNSRSHQLGHHPRDNRNRHKVYDSMESMTFEEIEKYFFDRKIKNKLINIRTKVFKMANGILHKR